MKPPIQPADAKWAEQESELPERVEIASATTTTTWLRGGHDHHSAAAAIKL
jgi:hypothetical protein